MSMRFKFEFEKGRKAEMKRKRKQKLDKVDEFFIKWFRCEGIEKIPASIEKFLKAQNLVGHAPQICCFINVME